MQLRAAQCSSAQFSAVHCSLAWVRAARRGLTRSKPAAARPIIFPDPGKLAGIKSRVAAVVKMKGLTFSYESAAGDRPLKLFIVLSPYFFFSP